jgi:signal transduction histidine kinase
MRFRPIIFAWCLLFGATLAMATAAWWLLGREADRVESLAAGTLVNRTASVAESIDLLMEEVRDGVNEGLLVVREAPEPRAALAELVEGNPYLVAGFYFRGSDAVTAWFGQRGEFPAPNAISEGAGVYPWTLPEFEQDRFVRLDAALPAAALTTKSSAPGAPSDAYVLSAPVPSAPAPEVEMDETPAFGLAESAAPAMRQEAVSQSKALKEQRAAVRKVNVENRAGLSSYADFEVVADQVEELELADAVPVLGARFGGARDLAADTVVAESIEPVDRQAATAGSVRQGWAIHTIEGSEQWLAWSSLPTEGDYLGVWLDRSALLAELSKAISLSQSDGLRFRLVDALGVVIAGDSALGYRSQSSRRPEFSLAVGNALPQWRIETFRAHGANTFGSSFRLVGGLFIAGLSFAILLGATVLIWQARRDARDAARKTSFVANVSHELKTPLTSIRLFADMLYDGRVQDPAKQRTYLQNMVNETQRLTRLVNNVLDFSRLERGQLHGQAQSIDLGLAVREIVQAQEDRLRADGLDVSVVTPEQSLSAPVDRDALEQILLNLLDNAAKYASSGERAEVVLTSEASQSGAWSLRVSDYGPGIPASERKQVFAAFHRVDDRLTAERPGCGLGLSIAARLAEEMGGTLTLAANDPNGCSFILKIEQNLASTI